MDKKKLIGEVYVGENEGSTGFFCSYHREVVQIVNEELLAYSVRSFIETLSNISASAQGKNPEQFQAEVLDILNRSFVEDKVDLKNIE